MTGGNQVKTITIRLPEVEAAMLVKVQKRNMAFRVLQGLLISQIQQEYHKFARDRSRTVKNLCFNLITLPPRCWLISKSLVSSIIFGAVISKHRNVLCSLPLSVHHNQLYIRKPFFLLDRLL